MKKPNFRYLNIIGKRSVSKYLNILFLGGLLLISMALSSNAIINGQTLVSGTVSFVSDDGIIELEDSGYLIQIANYCSMAEGQKAETLTEGWRLRALTLGRVLECQVFTGYTEAHTARELGVPLLASCVVIIDEERTVSIGYAAAQLSIPLNSTGPNPYPCSNWPKSAP